MRAARILAILAIAVPASAAAGVFTPQPSLGRYEGRTVVTGTDLRSRPAGLKICLADVLAKVSGDGSLVDDPRVKAVDPGPLLVDLLYVDRFSGIPHHDEQGSSDRPFYLTARFDPAKVDALLRNWGDTPYDGARPELEMVVSIGVAGRSRAVLGDDPRVSFEADALREAGDQVGMPVHLPRKSDIGKNSDGRAVLDGTLAFDDGLHEWLGSWSTSGVAVGPHAWRSADPSYDAAFRSGLRGALGLLAGHPPDAAR